MAEKKILIDGQGYVAAKKFLPYGVDKEFFALIEDKIYVKRSNERYEFLKTINQEKKLKNDDTDRFQ
jgi:hypothetical protein